MFKRREVIAAVLVFVLAVFTAAAFAQEHRVALKGEYWKKASGEAVIKDAGAGQKEITIDASGLKKDSVYTAWFVNKTPKADMAGIGAGDFSFRSDNKGNAHYVAAVPASEPDKWQLIEVAYHRNKNPKDMKKMKIALKGDLKKPS